VSAAFGKQPTTGTRRRPRLLLVEDDNATRHVYATCFRDAGWQVEEVVSAEEALAVAAAFLPAVILMDVRLPDRSCIETTRRLRRDPRIADVPIVMLGRRDCSIDAIATSGGVFVGRPCTARHLLSIVEAVLCHAATSSGPASAVP
jgi:two-component system phosphate regulon response regulator PhoB